MNKEQGKKLTYLVTDDGSKTRRQLVGSGYNHLELIGLFQLAIFDAINDMRKGDIDNTEQSDSQKTQEGGSK